MKHKTLIKNMMNWLGIGLVGLCSLGAAQATIITGGNASFNDADSVLDIVFAIDTSGSMSDDIIAIGQSASAAITTLNCPDDVWVRARFFGINGVSGSVFNENLRTFIVNNGVGNTGVSRINSTEDNGWAAADVASYYPWFANLPGDTSGKDLYKAVVTIGDEGTEDGAPVNQADWIAAVAANSEAIAKDVFLFSWITDDPFAGVPELFRKMAEGGTSTSFPAYTCGNTGGSYIVQGSGSQTAVVNALQSIICTAGGGGTNGGGEVPAPGTFALVGLGLACLRLRRR